MIPGQKRPPHYDWTSSYTTSDTHSAEKKQCFAQVGEIALGYERTSLYDRVPMEQKTTPGSLEALGSFLFYHGANAIKKELTTMTRNAVNLADKYQLLEKITEAFHKHTVDTPDAGDHKAEFNFWYKVAFKDILDTQQRATKDDGAALGEIARRCQDDVRDVFLSKLDAASTQTIAAFILSYSQDNTGLDSQAQSHCLQEYLDKLWQDFRYARAIRTYSATVEALNHYELADITDLTKRHSPMSISNAFDKMSEALAFVDDKYAVENLFPFVESIMSHKIPSLIVEDDSDLYETVAAYVQAVLCVYIRRYVGDEPQPLRNWSLPQRGCNNCSHCRKVGNFLADPSEIVLRHQILGPDRKHLDNEFGRRSVKDPQYDITIDTSDRPHSWIHTKGHKAYKRDHPKWLSRVQQTQQKFKQIGGKNMVYLKTYLDANFDAFTSCRAENLQNFVSNTLTNRESLRNLDASGLNTAGNRKRNIHTGGLVEPENGSAAKRTRQEDSMPGPAEVIDLT